MLCWSSAGLTTFTPLSVRLTTSGCCGITGCLFCAKRSVGTNKSGEREAGSGTRAVLLREKVSVARPASRFPLPSSRLQSFEQRVVARRSRDALDEPFHGGTGRHLL